MQGLMQDWPLLAHRVIDHAARNHGTHEVVTRTIEGPITRTNYRDIRRNALTGAKRLQQMGVKIGDRVATLGMNTALHLEAWYAITGMGAVYHTLNPRLFPEQLVYIVNHAQDRVLMTDSVFLPLVEKLIPQLQSLEHIIVLCNQAQMPQTSLANVSAYDTWLGEADADFEWVSLDENAAAGMCYTSGTTGHPKGVIYSHRSNILHAMTANQADMVGTCSRDRLLPVVPLFHANGWSLGFSAPMAGAAMIMPGLKMDGESIYELLDTEKVTLTAGVPTVWLMLLQYLRDTEKSLPHLKRIVIGGSAAPRAMIEAFEEIYGVEVLHAWGMTEMSPLGTVCSLKPEYTHLSGESRLDVQQKQGHTPFTVEMKITDDDNAELPWDGKTFGRLHVRGPAISSRYFKEEGTDILDDEGFFDTGDVAHIDAAGYMQITDRSKDVIKSGGEWISSIELENLAVGHPQVAEAAVIGIAHPKWDERPLLIVVRQEGTDVTGDDILEFMDGKIAKWWMPDAVTFVDEIPHTATGKILKTALREQFKDFKLA